MHPNLATFQITDEVFGGIPHALCSLCNVQISAGCTHSCDHCAIFHYLGVFHLPVASGVTDGDHYLLAAGRQKHACQHSVHYLCTSHLKSDTLYLDRLGWLLLTTCWINAQRKQRKLPSSISRMQKLPLIHTVQVSWQSMQMMHRSSHLICYQQFWGKSERQHVRLIFFRRATERPAFRKLLAV